MLIIARPRAEGNTVASAAALIDLERAARILGANPYWLVRELRARGFEILVNGPNNRPHIKRADLRALQESRGENSANARRLLNEQLATQRQDCGNPSRISWRNLLPRMRSHDPKLRGAMR